MTKTTRVTEKGQATIPKELRDKYGLQPGDEVVWLNTADGIVVTKRTRTNGRGLLVPDDTPDEPARFGLTVAARGWTPHRRPTGGNSRSPVL